MGRSMVSFHLKRFFSGLRNGHYNNPSLGSTGCSTCVSLPLNATVCYMWSHCDKGWLLLLLLYVNPSYLTHWGRVTHICVSKLTIIGSDNGLSPGRRQAIIWTNAGISLIRTLGTSLSEILSEIHAFSFKKMHLKMSSAKWHPFCLGLKVLTLYRRAPTNRHIRSPIWTLSCFASLLYAAVYDLFAWVHRLI